MNTKYLSENPISRLLIHGYFKTLLAMVSTIDAPLQKILDIGCGEGIVPRQLRTIWPSAVFHGLDINMELLQVARQLVPEFICLVGSIYKLPLTAEGYDLVFCTEVLEHLEVPESALAEITRVGKGYFLFSVPNEPLWRIANMLRCSYWNEWGNSPGHLNHWNAGSFVRFLSKYCKPVSVKRPFPWIMVLCQK